MHKERENTNDKEMFDIFRATCYDAPPNFLDKMKVMLPLSQYFADTRFCQGERMEKSHHESHSLSM